MEQREKCLRQFDIDEIDPPIMDLITGFAKLPYCFTLQSCYGHFLYEHQKDEYNTDALPVANHILHVYYKIAYLALCIENSPPGQTLFENLKRISETDPEYIQFGCAEWFWQSQVNSYVIQVEPKRFMMKDRAHVDYQEALHIEKVRDQFFTILNQLLKK